MRVDGAAGGDQTNVALSLGGCACNWIRVNPPELMNVHSTPGTTLAAPGAAASRPSQGANHLANFKMIRLPGSTSDLSNKDVSRRGPGMGDLYKGVRAVCQGQGLMGEK